ncbi:hypothetical protein [Kocuria rosea]|uniref:hypothetical protein n=1 Tax=Kocuria rosea TaxID=1275 RepID=UPI00126A3618|nr:hypothetical protein [Kocuria polaris]
MVVNYWWVNQGKTYEEEVDAGAIWAPFRSTSGGRQHHWDRMDGVQPGDLIIHYARKQIRAVGRALTASRAAPALSQGGDWDRWEADGREIRVAYTELEVAIPLGEIPKDLRRPNAPGSPFDSRGQVNQGYFFQPSEETALWIFERAGLTASTDDEDVVPVVPRGEEDHYEPVIVPGPDGTRIVGYRPEHSQLVDVLKKGRRIIPCALCGRALPAGLLVTAHIKRRADCSDTERVNPHVVMPACALGCDSLYERGFIVVNDAGRILRGPGAWKPQISCPPGCRDRPDRPQLFGPERQVLCRPPPATHQPCISPDIPDCAAGPELNPGCTPCPGHVSVTGELVGHAKRAGAPALPPSAHRMR